jgi:CheY-like chemotaxis protein
MFFNSHFTVLVVDDEPDVLSLTRLLLRDMELFGLPVHVETATSKHEAIDVFQRYNSSNSVQQMIAVALIDVVMETEQAGLELCEYIRTDLNNSVTQLYIRTGQPGSAPEQHVVDAYDINGYFLKSELDETRLSSLVKAGIRQATAVSHAVGGLQALEAIVVHGVSRRSLEWIMHAVINAINASGVELTADGERLARVDVAFLMDGQMISSMTEQETKELIGRLDRLDHHPFDHDGDYFTFDDRCYLMYIAPSSTTAEVYAVARGRMAPQRDLIAVQYLNNRIYAALWKQGATALAPA